jgi:glycosyltransferase involved in cell wall biosynthesis
VAIDGQSLAIIIPAYRAEATIKSVLDKVPKYVDWIVVVDDASPDGTSTTAMQVADRRIILIRHDRNLGVGGAMVTGFQRALELQADLIAKIDADGQMDPSYLDRFVRVCRLYGCDYVKANRFGHLDDIAAMPKIRLWGSVVLSFLTKLVSGYWNVFDPQNGYLLITRQMLKRLDLQRIHRGYFFENSMLILLNILRARIGEIYLPAVYAGEASSMKLGKILRTFPGHLLGGLVYRIYQKYFFRSLSPFFLLLVFGLICSIWGCLWGGVAWYKSYSTGIPATTGTVVLALLPLILGWSALLQAFVLDVQDAGPCLLLDYDDEALNPSRDDRSRSSNGPPS